MELNFFCRIVPCSWEEEPFLGAWICDGWQDLQLGTFSYTQTNACAHPHPQTQTLVFYKFWGMAWNCWESSGNRTAKRSWNFHGSFHYIPLACSIEIQNYSIQFNSNVLFNSIQIAAIHFQINPDVLLSLDGGEHVLFSPAWLPLAITGCLFCFLFLLF